MMHFRFNRLGEVCALVAATLILPVLAHAQATTTTSTAIDAAKRHSVPENGPGMALMITTIGAVLLFGAIQRSRAKT